jgi:uncharacterized membrane protein YciS (DUF1049 family)
MDPVVKELVTSLIPIVVGATGTGLGWLGRAIFKVKTDLDAAHCKIRRLTERIAELEDDLAEFSDNH